MPIEYEDNAELDKLIKAMMSKYHGRLVDHKVKIKGRLKIKTDKNGDFVKAQKLRSKLVRVNDLYKTKDGPDFYIIVDGAFWNNGEPKIREQIICFALDHLDPEITGNGELKLKKREPDIVEFSSNVRRFGAYTDELALVVEATLAITGDVHKYLPAAESAAPTAAKAKAAAKAPAAARRRSSPPPAQEEEEDERIEVQPQAEAEQPVEGGEETQEQAPETTEETPATTEEASGVETPSEETTPETAASSDGESEPEPEPEPEPAPKRGIRLPPPPPTSLSRATAKPPTIK